MIFEVHEAFEHDLGVFFVGEWTALAQLKAIVPVEVSLQ